MFDKKVNPNAPAVLSSTNLHNLFTGIAGLIHSVIFSSDIIVECPNW